MALQQTCMASEEDKNSGLFSCASYHSHTCAFYTCPLVWLASYRMESKATLSELGVFNLPQSLRACASVHVIHHGPEHTPDKWCISILRGPRCRNCWSLGLAVWSLWPSRGERRSCCYVRHLNRPPAALIRCFFSVAESQRERDHDKLGSYSRKQASTGRRNIKESCCQGEACMHACVAFFHSAVWCRKSCYRGRVSLVTLVTCC